MNTHTGKKIPSIINNSEAQIRLQWMWHTNVETFLALVISKLIGLTKEKARKRECIQSAQRQLRIGWATRYHYHSHHIYSRGKSQMKFSRYGPQPRCLSMMTFDSPLSYTLPNVVCAIFSVKQKKDSWSATVWTVKPLNSGGNSFSRMSEVNGILCSRKR